jgi:GntR family transcriptional regulator/MocR family aminotransferase
MRISLDRMAADGRPIYQRIAERIRGGVEAAELAPGDRLPPIRALARQLGVNRDTVALAYEALASAGVVEASVGRGTFVAGRPARGEASRAAPSLALSGLAERLLELDRSRPRFGSANGAVPLHTLIPDPSLYPSDEFRRVLNRVLAREGPGLLLYGEPQGHPRMREVLAERLRASGVAIGAEELVLCHGASQGISLAVRLFAGPGDVVALEEPTYNNVLATLAGLGLRTAPVPMREGGVDLALLERTLARPEVKVLYTIPTFHNPLGSSTLQGHRRALLEIAARHATPVIEDGYQIDLRFEGRSVPPLAAQDAAGIVVHLHSFSKSLFPGVRIGAVVARGRTLEALLALKRATDLSDAMPLQAALAEFVASGAYDRHLARLRRVLLGRRDALCAALERHLPDAALWTRPEGGTQVWIDLGHGIDTSDLLADAVGAGVLFAPGAQFHHDGRASSALRLAFAMADEAAIDRGVATLGRLVARRLAAGPRQAVGAHI